jgi:N-methylhydantoinase B
MAILDTVERRSERRPIGNANAADPIMTELVRNSFNSVARQMATVLRRTAVSPVIYESKDYAAGLFDKNFRMLGNSSGIPLFLNTFHLAVQRGVEAIGGTEQLTPGDVILYNWPFGSGTHPQDCTAFSPLFDPDSGEVAGYAVTKAHLRDIAGKEPYCTDTTDVFQEGVIYPGVRLYKGGVRNDDVWRIFKHNSRMPQAIEGDMNALHAALNVGIREFKALIRRFGRDQLFDCVERMFDHSETITRNFLKKIPDGRYVGYNTLDNDGVGNGPIPFEVSVEISGSDVTVDVSNAPAQLAGPFNSTAVGTESACRVAIMMLAGKGDDPNEGYFRPITVRTRPGTMFDALAPAPSFLQGITGIQLSEAVFEALSKALPESVPSGAVGDPATLVFWGRGSEGEQFWACGMAHIHGQGATSTHDGLTTTCVPEGAMTIAPVEIWEERYPWLVEKHEVAADSCGAGKFRGGMGVSLHIRLLEDASLTSTVEKTTTDSYAILGGTSGRRTLVYIRHPNGTRVRQEKKTGIKLRKGTVVEIETGGGSGYGSPTERTSQSIADDLLGGYITPEFARRHYGYEPDAASG